jgi:hypothetical protein
MTEPEPLPDADERVVEHSTEERLDVGEPDTTAPGFPVPDGAPGGFDEP